MAKKKSPVPSAPAKPEPDPVEKYEAKLASPSMPGVRLPRLGCIWIFFIFLFFAGALLDLAVDDMKTKGITPVYLVTDHVGFYERYGWEFLCMVKCEDKPEMSRLYIHR